MYCEATARKLDDQDNKKSGGFDVKAAALLFSNHSSLFELVHQRLGFRGRARSRVFRRQPLAACDDALDGRHVGFAERVVLVILLAANWPQLVFHRRDLLPHRVGFDFFLYFWILAQRVGFRLRFCGDLVAGERQRDFVELRQSRRNIAVLFRHRRVELRLRRAVQRIVHHHRFSLLGGVLAVLLRRERFENGAQALAGFDLRGERRELYVRAGPGHGAGGFGEQLFDLGFKLPAGRIFN